MNTVRYEPLPLEHKRDRIGGYIVTHKIADGIGMHLGASSAQIIETEPRVPAVLDSLIDLSPDEAIILAQTILKRYRVPFCNRVKKAEAA